MRDWTEWSQQREVYLTADPIVRPPRSRYGLYVAVGEPPGLSIGATGRTHAAALAAFQEARRLWVRLLDRCYVEDTGRRPEPWWMRGC